MSDAVQNDRDLGVRSNVKLTYDDYLRMPADGLRHELIGGVHFVAASPNLRHQRISANVFWMLRSYLETHPLGEVLYAPLDVVLSDFDVVEPDLFYVSRARAGRLRETHLRGAPDLIVEILSGSTGARDRTLKHALYERAGVDEYWLIDPSRDCVEVYRRVDAGRHTVDQLAGHADEAGRGQSAAVYVLARVLSREAGDVLTTALLPGAEFPLSAVFPA